MSKPCLCGECRVCYLYEHDAAYRAKFDTVTQPDGWLRQSLNLKPASADTVAERISLNCVSLGDELSAAATAALGLDTRRRWFQCQKGHGPQCVCKNPQTCGLGLCADYESTPAPVSKPPS